MKLKFDRRPRYRVTEQRDMRRPGQTTHTWSSGPESGQGYTRYDAADQRLFHVCYMCAMSCTQGGDRLFQRVELSGGRAAGDVLHATALPKEIQGGAVYKGDLYISK